MARSFEVKLMKSGSTMNIIVPARNPTEAKRTAEAQFPEYRTVGTIDKGPF